MPPIVFRIGAALTAGAFGQAVTIGSQLLLTPLFLAKWGPGQYGEWLLLSGIPAYLALADGGIGSAAGNEMTYRASVDDHAGAQRTFRGALIVALGAALLAMVAGALLAMVLGHGYVLQFADFSHLQIVCVLLALCGYVGVTFAGSVIGSGFRCCARNAAGIATTNITRLVEALATAAMLFLDQSPIVLALTMLFVKALGTFVQTLWLRSVCRWLFEPYHPPDLHLVRRLIKPALGFLAMPVSNALQLQGPLFIIGIVLGPVAVAAFSAMRTIARFPMQLGNMLNSSLIPEMAMAHGAGAMALQRRLFHAALAGGFAVTFATSALLFTFGNFIVATWLHNKLEYDPALLFVLLSITVISSIGYASVSLLAATNEHVSFGAFTIIASAVSLAVSFGAARLFGVAGSAGAMLLLEIALAAFAVRQALLIYGDSATALLRNTMAFMGEATSAFLKSLPQLRRAPKVD